MGDFAWKESMKKKHLSVNGKYLRNYLKGYAEWTMILMVTATWFLLLNLIIIIAPVKSMKF